MTDDDRLRALLARAAGPDATFAETHVSVLAFTRDRVLKAKKNVRFPFVDLSTPALRRANCERELALNRRLTPDVYLGCVALGDERGDSTECALEMVRLSDDDRLSTRLQRDPNVADCVDAVARVIAQFHGSAGMVRGAPPDELWEHELAEVERFANGILLAAVVHRVATLARRYVAGRTALFAEREAAGRCRDGHGDLLVDDIFCLPDGPRVLDCLEFDDRLRAGDTLNDIAFLAMDLEWRGRPDLAERLLATYGADAHDEWPTSLAHLYIAYRAHVRSKVACLRAEQGDRDAAQTAVGLLQLSREHLEAGRVRLLLVGGLPGTGKSTVAAALAEKETAVLLRSDEVRKQLAGVASGTRAGAAYGEGIYTATRTDATYEALLTRARTRLERGDTVVLDASWSRAAHRRAAAAMAVDTTADLVALQCVAPEAVARQRIEARAARRTDPSDATAAIARRMAGEFDRWDSATIIDTTASLEATLEAATQAARRPPA